MLFLALLFAFAKTILAINIIGGGIPNGSFIGYPYRYEINHFSTSGPPWDLYIQALTHIQGLPASDPMSYFQIAGIHGFPNIPWDGVSGRGSNSGFCFHSSQLFPTWHRPYLALFEQALYQAAQSIADSYPDDLRAKYRLAASALRIPFWDSVAGPTLPWQVTIPTLQVTTPSGPETVANPLLNFTFPDGQPDSTFPTFDLLTHFNTTVRWWNKVGNFSDQDAATASLQSNGAAHLSSLYRIFTTVNDYPTFASTENSPNGSANAGNSIEQIHNDIHNSVGGFGHMTEPMMSAYDPVFWLHHANVDRQLAMWQVLYPDSYIVSQLNKFGNYYETPNTLETALTSLAPFHNSEDGSTMWTSDAVRSLATFRYTYPEIPYSRMNSSALIDNVKTAINKLYNPPASSQRKRSLRRRPSRNVSLAETFSHITFEDAKNMGINNAERQWFASIELQKYAYDKTFSIFAFIGQPPSDCSEWSWAPNLVGTHGQFIATDVSCMFHDGAPQGLLRSEISLTHTLVAGVDRGILPNLEPKTVVPLLKQGLQWRAQAYDGDVVDVGHLAGFSVVIGSRSVTPAASDCEFPVYGEVEWHPEVTLTV